MRSEKKHHMWIDYCRLIAIIFVIINHSNEEINLNPIGKSSVLFAHKSIIRNVFYLGLN